MARLGYDDRTMGSDNRFTPQHRPTKGHHQANYGNHGHRPCDVRLLHLHPRPYLDVCFVCRVKSTLVRSAVQGNVQDGVG